MRGKTISKLFSAVLSAAMLITSIPASAIAAPIDAAGAGEEESGNPLRLWYDEPATDTSAKWQEESLPIGNGDIGANIYGGIATEHLTFNEKTLWTGGPSSSRPNYMGGNIESRGKNGETLKEIQQLFKDGKATEASEKCNQLTGGSEWNDGYGAYQPWGDIYFDYQGVAAGDAVDYVRDLDLKTALSTVSFQAGGTTYKREYFISNPDNVLAAELSAEGSAKLNLDIRFTNQHGETAAASGDTIVLAGELSDNQLKYDSVMKVVNTGGTVTANGAKLEIRNADSIQVFLSAATDYKNDYPEYRTGETSEELHARVEKTAADAASKGYDAVKKTHLEDYKELFDRMELTLGETVSTKTTDELLNAYNNGTAREAERRQLEIMLFQYGRYLTIASSRENSQLPSNLQGVWNNSTSPSWHADYHTNVNLQMNYWPTYVTNLAECGDPLVRYIDSLREPGRVTAKVYAGIESTEENPENGFMAHTQNTPFGWTCPGWAFNWGWSPAAMPWIIQNCWEYYDFTRDEEYLKKNIYPMMREEAVLYDQMLVEDNDGKLVSSPSYSPEHGPRTNGNTYEQVLIWQLYEDVITAAEIVGEKDSDRIQLWKDNQANLKGPIEIGSDGQIKEWFEETTLDSMNSQGSGGFGHRHISHMLGLFPGDLVSVETPEWFEASIVSMNNRTDESTGWGMGQRINTWARLRDGNRAYKLITDLFKNGIYKNLWDTHPPFQIDGNFGYTSGVAEMLLQSNIGYIDLHPALPDGWVNGQVNGLLARGGFEVDFNWTKKQMDQVNIKSNKGETAIVQYEGIGSTKVTDESGNLVSVTKVSDDRISFETEAGKSYQISGFKKEPMKALDPDAYISKKTTDQITLSWDEDIYDDVVYNVYRQTEDGEWEKIAENLTGNSYTDTAAYSILGNLNYRVTAVNNVGESDSERTIQRQMEEMVDDRDSRIKYSDGWSNYSDSVNYAGTIKFIQTPTGNETAELSFNGTGIEVIVCTNYERGKLEILIDDESCGEVDTYSSNTVRQKTIFSKTDLDPGDHKILVKVTATKCDSSRGTKVELDAFKIIYPSILPELPADSPVQILTVEKDRVMAQWKETEDAEAYKVYVNDKLVATVENPYAWIPNLSADEAKNITVKAVVGTEEQEDGISFEVTAGKKLITDISVQEKNKELTEGEEYDIRAAAVPADSMGKELKYVSSNPNVATVDDAGKVKAIAAGETNITISSILSPMVTETVQVTVIKKQTVDANPDNSGNPADPNPPGGLTGQGGGSGAPVPPAENTDIDDGDFAYKVTKNSTVKITGLTAAGKKKTALKIPDSITTKDQFTLKVTAIDKNAFNKNKKLKSVVIGKNITSIGAGSFTKCSKLKSIQFTGTKVPAIKKGSFKGIKSKCTVYYSKKMKKLATLKKRMKAAGVKKPVYKKKK